MNHPSSRGVAGGAVVFLLLVLVHAVPVLDLLLEPQQVAGDFVSFYLAGQGAGREGLNLYDTQALRSLMSERGYAQRVFPYLYPPPFAYVLAPLAKLDLLVAQRVWAGLLVLCMAGVSMAVGASARHVFPSLVLRGELATYLPWVLPVLLAWPLAFRENVVIGQSSVLVLLLLALYALLLLQGRDTLAALPLAVAILIKITPALLVLVLVARRRWRALAACVGGLVVLCLLSLALGAWPSWVHFFEALPHMSHGKEIPGLYPPSAVWNISLAGVLSRASDSGAVVLVGSILFTLGLSALALFLIQPRDSRGDAMAVSMLLIVMVLASPWGYTHHVVVILPAVMWVMLTALELERPRLALLALALATLGAMPLHTVYLRQPEVFPPRAAWMSLNTYALLGLYALAGVLAWRTRVAPTPSTSPSG